VFVDKTGTVWSIDANMKTTRHGYDWIFGEYRRNTLVNYHTQNRLYYITTGSPSYTFDGSRLSSEPQGPSSLVFIDGQVIGPVKNFTWTKTVGFTTTPFDMGIRGLKTIHNIHCGFYNIDNAQVRLAYKMDNDINWTWTGYLPVNQDGVVTPIITAVEFKVELSGDVGGDSRVDYLTIRYRVGDKRAIRGQV